MNKRFNPSLKNLILGLAAAGAIGLATPVLAEQQHRMLDRLDHKLELNDQQREQIGNLIEVHRDQMREMRQAGDGQRGEARGQWRESRMALNEEIRELLSAEQAETFDAMHERKGRKHRRGGRAHSGYGMKALDLSDEQRQAMRELMREHRDDRAAVREGMRDILDDEQMARLEEMRAQHGGKERKQRRQRGNRDS